MSAEFTLKVPTIPQDGTATFEVPLFSRAWFCVYSALEHGCRLLSAHRTEEV